MKKFIVLLPMVALMGWSAGSQGAALHSHRTSSELAPTYLPNGELNPDAPPAN